MLSREMYNVIKYIPHQPKIISYKELEEKVNIDPERLSIDITVAGWPQYDYIDNDGESQNRKSSFCLTEHGQAAIEEYRINRRNNFILILSFITSLFAMVAAVVSTIKVFCPC